MTSTGFNNYLTSRSMEIVFQHNTLNKLLIFSQVRLNLYVIIRINKVQTLNSTVISCIDNAKKLAQSHSHQRAPTADVHDTMHTCARGAARTRRTHSLTHARRMSLARTHTHTYGSHTLINTLSHAHTQPISPATMTTISYLMLRVDRSRFQILFNQHYTETLGEEHRLLYSSLTR